MMTKRPCRSGLAPRLHHRDVSSKTRCLHREASSLLQRRVYLYEQHYRYGAFFMLQGDYWRMPRPLTSKRAQAMYSTIVATTIKVRATLILMSETPRMP